MSQRKFEPIWAENPDGESAIYGAQLGASVGPSLLKGLADLVVLLDRNGGQAFITAYRRKVREDGTFVAEDKDAERTEEGEWMTVGYIIQFENRDQRLGVSPFPDPEADPETEHVARQRQEAEARARKAAETDPHEHPQRIGPVEHIEPEETPGDIMPEEQRVTEPEPQEAPA